MNLNFRQLALSALTAGLIGSLASCATIIAPKTGSVTITVTPDSSKIYANGEFMGYSPVHLELNRRTPQLIEISKEGYEPQKRILKTEINPLWVGADVLTLGVGAIIDAATGAWLEFKPSIIIMDLSKL